MFGVNASVRDQLLSNPSSSCPFVQKVRFLLLQTGPGDARPDQYTETRADLSRADQQIPDHLWSASLRQTLPC